MKVAFVQLNIHFRHLPYGLLYSKRSQCSTIVSPEYTLILTRFKDNTTFDVKQCIKTVECNNNQGQEEVVSRIHLNFDALPFSHNATFDVKQCTRTVGCNNNEGLKAVV